MKKIFTSLGLFLFINSAFSQEIDTIQIWNSHSSWPLYNTRIVNEKLIYIKKSENTYLRFQLTIGNIRIYDSISKNTKFLYDTISKVKVVKVNFETIAKFINRLDSSSEKNIDVNTLRNYFSTLNRRQIKKISTRKDRLSIHEHFIENNIDREILDSIRWFSALDSFYYETMKREIPTIFDASNFLKFEIHFQNKKITLSQNFLSNKGQPMIVRNYENAANFEKIFNPILNIELVNYLPRKSKLKNYFGLENYFYSYCRWYQNYYHIQFLRKLYNYK